MKISLNVSRACIVHDRYVTVYLEVPGIEDSVKAVFRGPGAAAHARDFLRDAGVEMCTEIDTKSGAEVLVHL
jgi:hypothetical protein